MENVVKPMKTTKMLYCLNFLNIFNTNYQNGVLSQFSQHFHVKTPKMLYCPNKPKELNFSRSGRVTCLRAFPEFEKLGFFGLLGQYSIFDVFL